MWNRVSEKHVRVEQKSELLRPAFREPSGDRHIAIERSLAELRKMMRKNHRDPDHLNSIQIQPSGERKARVLFHVFPEKHRGNLKMTIEQLANTAMEQKGIESCVVLARGTETWDSAYDVVMLVQPRHGRRPNYSEQGLPIS